jgi:hypothetical protein
LVCEAVSRLARELVLIFDIVEARAEVTVFELL